MIVQLQGLVSTIGILDIIDIVVVAYFLYRVYLMLKNTRAATLVKGLLVLVGFMIICRTLNLHVISWLLEKSMTVIMVALPVVFQPELRRALEQIGRGKLFRKGSELDEQEVNAMLDLVKQETERIDSTFLEMKAPKLIQINYSSAVTPRGYIFGKRVHFAGRVSPGCFCFMEVAT